MSNSETPDPGNPDICLDELIEEVDTAMLPLGTSLEFGTSELLRSFDGLLEALLGVADPEVEKELISKYLMNLAVEIDLKPDDPVRVNDPVSICYPSEPDTPLTIFEPGHNMWGAFGGLAVGSWFDIPEGIVPDSSELHIYERPHGLYLLMCGAVIQHKDGRVGYEQNNTIAVSLHNGSPQLFKT